MAVKTSDWPSLAKVNARGRCTCCCSPGWDAAAAADGGGADSAVADAAAASLTAECSPKRDKRLNGTPLADLGPAMPTTRLRRLVRLSVSLYNGGGLSLSVAAQLGLGGLVDVDVCNIALLSLFISLPLSLVRLV